MFEADHLYIDHVGRDSVYGFRTSQRVRIFNDEDSTELYSPDKGRDTVSPSLLANARIMKTYDRVSDRESKGADCDLHLEVAPGIGIEKHTCATSTQQMFRAQLILLCKIS